MRIRRLSLLILFFSLPVFSVAVRVGAAPVWVSPPAQQPGGNIAPPLNTSGQAQTKKGGLTIEGNVNIDFGQTLTLGRWNGGSKICWNGTCKSGWTELTTTTGYLTLNQTVTPTDTGYIDLNQTGLAASDIAAATVTGRAGEPSLSASANIPTYGIQGVATKPQGTENGESVGVYGLATVATSSFHYGIFAYAADVFPMAWAGYFRGDVAVSDMAGSGTYDLVIGGGPAVDNNTAEICLGNASVPAADRCKSSWPASGSGTGHWTLSGSTLSPKELDPPGPRSIAFAGAGPTAPFYAKVNASDAELTIRGSAQFDQFVVGKPSNIPPVTCGDGTCTNPPENDEYCSSPDCRDVTDYYCPQDCDVTPPGNAQPVISSTSFRPCLPGDCPVPRFVVGWINPSDPDFKATRLIIRTDNFPVGPNDRAGAAVEQDFSILASSFDGGNCSVITTYYAGLYAYDNMNNFAAGSLFSFTPPTTSSYLLCTDQGVVYEVE